MAECYSKDTPQVGAGQGERMKVSIEQGEAEDDRCENKKNVLRIL